MMLRGQSLVLRCFLGTVPSGFHLGHGALKEPTCQLTPSSQVWSPCQKDTSPEAPGPYMCPAPPHTGPLLLEPPM